MAYSTFPSTTIESGKPGTTDLWTKTSDNFVNHESRITSLEGGSSVTYWPLEFHVAGFYGVQDELDFKRVPFDITLLAGRLLIKNAGSGSSTTIDMEYKRGAGAWTTIFTTKPSVTSASGDYAVSTNGVLGVTALQSGDLLRLNIDTKQDGSPEGLQAILEFSKT